MQEEILPIRHDAITESFCSLNVLENALSHFGKQLKAAREAKGLKQAQLAKLIGLDDGNSVSRIEQGGRPPSWPVLEKIFSVLGEPPAYYFSEERAPLPKETPSPEEVFEAVSKITKALSDLPPGLVSRLAGLNAGDVKRLGEVIQLALNQLNPKPPSPKIIVEVFEPDPGRPKGRG